MFPNDMDFESEFTMETESAVPVEEIPFHILMLGDWSGKGLKTSKIDLDESSPIEIDRDNFDEVMIKLNVGLELDLYNDETTILPLSFTNIDDFHPDQIYRQVQLFADLRELRQRLLNPDTYDSAVRDISSSFDKSGEDTSFEIESPSVETESVPVSSGNLLDQILSQPNEKPNPAKSKMADNTELGRLLEKLVAPHLIKINETQQSEFLSMLDEAASDLMRAILHHRHFQQLEAAWRGLHLLVRRLETDSQLKIFIFDISKPNLINSLKSVNRLADSSIYHQIITKIQNDSNSDPWSVICGVYSFDLNVDDVAALLRLAQISEIANAPFISHIMPKMLGIASLTLTDDSAKWIISDESIEGKLWATLRAQPESAYLGLMTQRILGRLPYGSDTESLETFSFEEFSVQPEHEQYLWMNPCFISVLLLAQSFRLSNWDMRYAMIQEVDNLPTHISRNAENTVVKPCAEIFLTTEKSDVMLEQGLMPMICFRDSEIIRLARFQSIANPVSSLKGRWS